MKYHTFQLDGAADMSRLLQLLGLGGAAGGTAETGDAAAGNGAAAERIRKQLVAKGGVHQGKKRGQRSMAMCVMDSEASYLMGPLILRSSSVAESGRGL